MVLSASRTPTQPLGNPERRLWQIRMYIPKADEKLLFLTKNGER